MKRLPFGAALAALMLTTSFVMADNAFSDVTPDDWSYKAVSQLADEGVIDGYPDGTFKGNKNITRYEMGQIVARLMAKEDTLTADQKATLDKLSTDYAGELDNLGVRVDKLENQVFKDTTFSMISVPAPCHRMTIFSKILTTTMTIPWDSVSVSTLTPR